MLEMSWNEASVALVVFGTTLYWWGVLRSSSNNKSSNSKSGALEIPWAPEAVPILGHALAYRKDPPGFLLRSQNACGPIFRINLAGRTMVLVCGPEEQRQLATYPESVMSARKAVGDIGFEQTLGYKNVHEGTQIHKGIVKAIWSNKEDTNPADRQLTAWLHAIRNGLINEISQKQGDELDFLTLIRRVMLRASVEMFVGKAFLRDWTSYDFLEEFMDFQDTLEDVTAKAAVLPKWFSLVTLLWPLQRRREQMQLVICQRLETMLSNTSNASEDSEDIGFWFRDVLNQKVPTSDIAEYIVGLMFAAHKNPAIGAAQSYLMLREYGSEAVQGRCFEEAKLLASTTSPLKWSQFNSSLPTLRRICLEALRLTAHSIGGVRAAERDTTLVVRGSTNEPEEMYNIPKGSTVGFAHITSSLDSSLWGADANKYDSDGCRYPEENYNDDYKFTTFSHGTHKCPGRQLAMIHLEMVVALLLTEFDVVLPEKIPSLDFERATLAQREHPVMVTITKLE